MGLSADTLGTIAGNLWGWHDTEITEERVEAAGLDPKDRRLTLALTLARELTGFPRHLPQHTGGFVIARDSLEALVPIENASMADCTVIEWDKDDIDALGILKVDVLGLSMLTCVRKGFDLLRHHYGRDLALADIPEGDEATYEMLSRADSLDTFQVESRAQISMLARLKPRNFYDLVIEVAIVRPGPIQGDMVHPYLRRREGKEPVVFPSKDLEQVLGKTLGVPLFQEQAMKIAIVAADFTPEEADQLRRTMATFKNHGHVTKFYEKMVGGMIERGYDAEFAERCFKQIEGFGTYGFPESHAASFALIVYVSSWMKCHYPDVFAAALLNSQPLGFYAPAQIVRDAVDHGVRVLPVDVNHSDWDCTLEPGAGLGRLGRHRLPARVHAQARPPPDQGPAGGRHAAAGGSAGPGLWLGPDLARTRQPLPRRAGALGGSGRFCLHGPLPAGGAMGPCAPCRRSRCPCSLLPERAKPSPPSPCQKPPWGSRWRRTTAASA